MSGLWFVVCIPKKTQAKKDIPATSPAQSRGDSLESAEAYHRNGAKRAPQTNVNEVQSDDTIIPDAPKAKERKLSGPSVQDEFLEDVLADTLRDLKIHNAVWTSDKSNKCYQVYFPCEYGVKSDEALALLTSKGIGRIQGSSLGVVPFTLFYHDGGEEEEKLLDAFSDNCDKSDQESNGGEADGDAKKEMTWFKAMQQTFLKSVTARLTVAQVVEGIRAGADLTFDFVCYVLSASMIAALGLMENSPVSLIASMLVSPLMGPILAATFGTMIQDKTLRNLGIKSGSIGLLMCVTFGFVFGIITLDFARYWNPTIIWPTLEMQARGQSRSLWVGTLVAIPSGMGVGLAILAGNTASLVGVAISASLLPPAVNCGLLLAMSFLKYCHGMYEVPVEVSINGQVVQMVPSFIPAKGYQIQYSHNMAVECAVLGIISLCLTLVNILCIVIVALIVLKIKEVAPHTSIPQTKRFWKQDIKIVRDYQKTLVHEEASTLGREFIEEWAHLTGLDPDKVMSDKAEAKLTRMNTLQDMMEEVEADEVYRTVRKFIPGPQPEALNRLSLTWHPKDRTRSSEIRPSIFDVYSTADSRLQRQNAVLDRRAAGGRRILTRLFSVKNHIQEAVHPATERREEEVKLTDADHKRRESLLKQTLQRRPHSPYSLWPSNRPRGESRFTVTKVDEESESESAEVVVHERAPTKQCLV